MKRYFRNWFKYHDGGIGLRPMLALLDCAAALTALGVGRVALVFRVSDLRIEAAQLQDRYAELETRRKTLSVAVHSYQDGDRLLQVAERELKMISFPLLEIEKLTVSQETAMKYDVEEFNRNLPGVRIPSATGEDADPGGRGLGLLLSALSFLGRD